MLRALAIGLGVIYPALVYAGLSYFEPRTLALALGAGVGVRVLFLARRREGVELRRVLLAPACVGGVLVVTAFLNEGRVFLFVPVLVNAALLLSFGLTLHRGPSMIETFARLQVDDLSSAEQRYAVTVTWVWCGFFLLNGGVALALALEASVAVWALYTGLLSYLLMGALFCGEFLYRTWRFRRYVGGPLNPLLERVFPPLDGDRRDPTRA